MKPPCEAMVMHVLPSARAIVAKILVEKHGFSQKVAAEKLGTTQPAISQYKRLLRGNRTDVLKSDSRVMEILRSLADKAAKGEHYTSVTEGFCELCKYMKSSGLLCEIHKKMYPSLEDCSICLE